jgi:hypothetical protein
MALRKCRILTPLTQSIVHVQETGYFHNEFEFESGTAPMRSTHSLSCFSKCSKLVNSEDPLRAAISISFRRCGESSSSRDLTVFNFLSDFVRDALGETKV